MDYAKTFADMAKAVHLIQDAGRLTEIVARAFVEAQAPTPGPWWSAAEDMLEDSTAASVIEPLRVPHSGSAAAADIDEIAALIARAERPLLIAGGGGSGRRAGARRCWRRRSARPACRSPSSGRTTSQRASNYAGHLGSKIAKAAGERYPEADLILVVGTRLGEATT